MTGLALILIALAILASTAVMALAFTSKAASRIAASGAAMAGAVGIGASIGGLSGESVEVAAAWQVPGGELVVGLDPLSAFFLVPLFVIGALAAFYGRAYMADRSSRTQARSAAVLNLLLAMMGLVVIARHGMLFLVAWEAMTLLAYLLVTTDHEDPEVRRAGWVFLIASHIAMMALIALFLALANQTGSLEFSAFETAAEASPLAIALIFGLALVGFGVKAGVLGLHIWLPEAHAAAPSHVSALMSAVMIKLGVYGIVRIAWLAPNEAFGVVLMALGGVGATFAIAVALYQRDIKRVLAYSSVENVGIILLGVGLGLWGHARGDARLAVLGLTGGLLHVWNHAAMKAMMFFGAGNVVHATGTRDLERLGGVLRRMRLTGTCLVIGAIAIAALPPLNAFVSEWLLYRGLTSSVLAGAWGLPAMAGVAVLALVGGLAALCFVRVVGVALLGQPRSEAARAATEAPVAMTAPVVVLATVCIAIAVCPQIVITAFAHVVGQLGGTADETITTATDALQPLAIANVVLLALVITIGVVVVLQMRRAESDATWGCGYLAPATRMQYTGRAFSELLTRLLPRALGERSHIQSPQGTFPQASSIVTDCTDPITRVYEPLLSRGGDVFARLRWVQQGNLHAYLFYILLIAVLGLTWAAVRDWLL